MVYIIKSKQIERLKSLLIEAMDCFEEPSNSCSEHCPCDTNILCKVNKAKQLKYRIELALKEE